MLTNIKKTPPPGFVSWLDSVPWAPSLCVYFVFFFAIWYYVILCRLLQFWCLILCVCFATYNMLCGCVRFFLQFWCDLNCYFCCNLVCDFFVVFCCNWFAILCFCVRNSIVFSIAWYVIFCFLVCNSLFFCSLACVILCFLLQSHVWIFVFSNNPIFQMSCFCYSSVLFPYRFLKDFS